MRAKRSNPSRRAKKEWIASSQVLLAMTLIDKTPRSRGVDSPEVCLNFPLSDIRGRRECRALDAPAASRANERAHEHSHHGHTGNHPAFPAQWFYGLLRALPGDHACLTPSPALLIADLTPGIGASGPHDLAVRTSAIRQKRRPRPPHPAPRP